MSSSVFKALTRPAMLFGIPMIPFCIACGFWVLVAIWVNFVMNGGILIAIAVIPTILTMRAICKTDDYAFRLLFLKLKTRAKSQSRKFFKADAFVGESYRRPSINTIREKNMNLNLFDVASYSKFIPFSSLVDDSIVMTREGFYLASWKLEGVPFLTVDDDTLDMQELSLDTFFRSYAEHPITFYTHSVREDAKDSLKSNFEDNEYLEEIDNRYFEGFKNQIFKKNTFYLTIVYNPFSTNNQKNEFKSLTLENKRNFIEFQIQEMQGYISSISEGLKPYNRTLLTTYERDNITFSSQLSFYNFLLTHNWQEIKVNSSPIYNQLGDVSIFFNKNLGEIDKNNKKKFFQCIEIKDFENELGIGHLDALLCASGDYVLTQSFTQMGQKQALSALKLQEKQLRSAEDDATIQVEELEIAKNDLASGLLSFGHYHLTLMVYGDSIKEVEDKTNELNTSLNNLGFITSLASIALGASYWSQLPGNFSYRPRIPVISSRNFVNMVGFHTLMVGKPYNNCWGDAVTLLKTPSGQPYYFNYHLYKSGHNSFGEKWVGHTLILGASGTGKTALMNFLFNQSRKFNAQDTFSENADKKSLLSIYFDKDRGAQGNILASGGDYLTVKLGEKTGFAPFKNESTEKNIGFLTNLIHLLVTRRGEHLSSVDELNIAHAVRAVMSLPFEYRGNGISRLIENLPKGTTEEELANSLATRLGMWAQGGTYGWVFDNDEDLLDFTTKSNIGIDGTDFLDDPNTSAPIAHYLIHKIYSVLDGRRGQLYIDEAWKYLNDPIISDALNNLLVTARKSDWMIVLGTQSPNQILQSPLARPIIEQCENFILLPNMKAKWSDYEILGITEKEFQLIIGMDSGSRQFVIKNSNGSTQCILNLGVLGNYLKLISTAKDNVEILEKTILEKGNNPKNWINTYLERAI